MAEADQARPPGRLQADPGERDLIMSGRLSMPSWKNLSKPHMRSDQGFRLIRIAHVAAVIGPRQSRAIARRTVSARSPPGYDVHDVKR